MPRWSPFEPYFWSLVEKTSGCWIWNGNVDSKGYGRIGIGQRRYRAHRVSYEITNGPIPDNKLACHTCDNKRCVRPDHIFIGTHSDNLSDAIKKGRHRAPVMKGADNWLRQPRSLAYRVKLSQRRRMEFKTGKRIPIRDEWGHILGTKIVKI